LWKAHCPNGILLLSSNFFTWIVVPVHGNLSLIILLAEVTCEYPKLKTKYTHENIYNACPRKQAFHTIFNKVTWWPQGEHLSFRRFRVGFPDVPVSIIFCPPHLHLCQNFRNGKHTQFLHMAVYPLDPNCKP